MVRPGGLGAVRRPTGDEFVGLATLDPLEVDGQVTDPAPTLGVDPQGAPQQATAQGADPTTGLVIDTPEAVDGQATDPTATVEVTA